MWKWAVLYSIHEINTKCVRSAPCSRSASEIPTRTALQLEKQMGCDIFITKKKNKNRRGLIANGPMNIRFPRTDALGAKKGKALDKPVKVLSSLQKRICAYWDFSFISHVNTAAIRNTSVVKSESKAFLQCLDLISSKAALYKNIFFSFMWFYFPDLCILTEGRKQSITGFRTNIA